MFWLNFAILCDRVESLLTRTGQTRDPFGAAFNVKQSCALSNAMLAHGQAM